MKFFSFIVLILIFGSSEYVIAQEEKEEKSRHQFEELTVTATRTERTTEEIPAGVSVVTREDIKNSRMFNIKDALEGIPGVQTESKNGGYDARLIIRGAGLKARYGVREIMVLRDGVPITDPDGMTRLDFVDTELVERIDVVKGPNSTLYGANAAGGVINIISRSVFNPQKSVKAGYGSDNTQMVNATIGDSFGDTYFSVTGSRRSTDSWRKWNKFSTNQGNIKLGRMVDENTSLEATVSYTNAEIQLPGTLTKEQFESDISQLTSEPWRNSGRYSNVFFTNVKMEKEIGNWKFRPLLFYQWWYHYHPVTGLINDGGADVYGGDFQADFKHSIFAKTGILTIGVSGQLDKADGNKYAYRDVTSSRIGRILSTFTDAKGQLAEIDDDTTYKWGIFVQESLRPSDRWIIDLGIRYDRVNFNINEQQFLEYDYASGKYISNPQNFRTNKDFEYVSPRVGVVYKLTDILNIYGNIATGFQTPQSSELNVNPDLDPMKVYNYEIGLKTHFKEGHSIDLSLYYITAKDEIVQTIEQGNVTSYSNAGETRKKGIELSVKARILKGFFLGGSYAYSDFHFHNFFESVKVGTITVPVDRSGNRLPYIPEHQYSLFALYKHSSGFKAKVDVGTWGKYYVDNANSETYSGYNFLTNILVGYEKKHWDIAFDVYNLFDHHYAMEVTKEVGGLVRYRPGGPRSLMVRVTFKF